MKVIRSQEVIEKEVVDLHNQLIELEEVLKNTIKETKKDKFAKSFQDMDLDIEVPANLDFLEEPIIIEKVTKSKSVKTENKVITLTSKNVFTTEELYNKLMQLEKIEGKKFAVKYLSGYMESIKSNNEYDTLLMASQV